MRGDASMKKGMVYLVGAGPNDPELLTVKAFKVLRKADVVVYDRLVTKVILRLTPAKAERIYVGKRSGQHAMPQDKICAILTQRARSGKVVIRLKGGDPFLFGRGAEEALEIKRAGVQFEVVPGITSALAVPAYAGIPLTHRDYASSVAIVTGHEHPGKLKNSVKWEKLAGSVDTLIVLMGVKRLKAIVRRLIKGGRDQKTNVAIIEWGTTRRQRKIIGTLEDIIEKANKSRVKAPAVIVVGDVVSLQQELSWFKGSQCRLQANGSDY